MRRVRHHLVLAGICVVLVFFIAQSFTAPLQTRLSAATAYTSLLCLAATLLLGPVNVMLRRPNPLSTDVRRDLGLWAAALATIHTLLVVATPLRPDIWRIFAVSPGRLTIDSMSTANDVGLAATLLILLLAAISNDGAMRLFGGMRWKSLQRLSYLLFFLAVAHTLLYDRLVQPGPFYELLLLAAVMAVLTLQINGWLERNARRAASIMRTE
jgi:methionine sulfoxide reductase heme-binding subunit